MDRDRFGGVISLPAFGLLQTSHMWVTVGLHWTDVDPIVEAEPLDEDNGDGMDPTASLDSPKYDIRIVVQLTKKVPDDFPLDELVRQFDGQ